MRACPAEHRINGIKKQVTVKQQMPLRLCKQAQHVRRVFSTSMCDCWLSLDTVFS